MALIDDVKAELVAAKAKINQLEDSVKTHIFISIPIAFGLGVLLGIWAF